MISINCGKQHAPAILTILNDVILHSTALYHYQPRTLDAILVWMDEKTKGRYPVIGVETAEGEFMGFASYGPFRPWPAYKYSIEHSIYVDARYRGRGAGKKLLAKLIKKATAQDYHMMIGGIDSSNKPSIALHKRFGFQHCGNIKHAGFKFSKWLDLEFYQLILPTPSQPVEK